jgi:isocitrate dehydrogenase kinase/phosphatase
LAVRSATARAAAAAAARAYAAWDSDFRWATRRAGARFAARDWAGAEADAARRLALWYRWVDAAVADARRYLGAAVGDRALWAAARDAYAAEVDGRDDGEVAESFYNSFARRVLRTPGLDPALHFVRRPARRAGAAAPTAAEVAAVARPLPVGDGPEATARALLGVWRGPAPLSAPYDVPRAAPASALDAGVPPRAWPPLAAAPGDPRWRDLEGEVARVAAALAREARAALGGWPDAGDVVATPFHRGQAAYVVGRLGLGPLGDPAGRRCPLVVALRHPAGGVEVDAVLAGEDEASVVFGFAWSYFHVEARRPAALVDYLASVLPRKRVDELYTAVGYHRHAKTELFRALHAHLTTARGRARFERPPGARGLVMECVALPSLELVLKVIKDRFGAPKRTTRREVMERYQYVFVRDRVGPPRRRAGVRGARLPAAATSPRRCSPSWRPSRPPPCARRRPRARHALRTPSASWCRSTCSRAPRRPTGPPPRWSTTGRPSATSPSPTSSPGDLLLKNFGVSRHGRVIFYDYDELTSLAECRFRSLPDLGDDDDFSPEPTYGVHEHDVFPEEFARFAVPQGPLRDAFVAAHGDLLDPAWWEATQRRLADGELVETFPYPPHRRLGAPGAGGSAPRVG